MGYAIRMGIPEMEDLWNSLQTQYRDGSLNKKDRELYKKLLTARAKKYPEPRKPWAKTLCAENKKAADSNTENLQNPNQQPHVHAPERFHHRTVRVRKTFTATVAVLYSFVTSTSAKKKEPCSIELLNSL